MSRNVQLTHAIHIGWSPTNGQWKWWNFKSIVAYYGLNPEACISLDYRQSPSVTDRVCKNLIKVKPPGSYFRPVETEDQAVGNDMEFIRKTRKELGLSVAKIAALLGLTAIKYAKLENGIGMSTAWELRILEIFKEVVAGQLCSSYEQRSNVALTNSERWMRKKEKGEVE